MKQREEETVQKEHDKHPLPEHQRKLLVLGLLAGIIIFLFWIWTLPLNFHERDRGENAGSIFGAIKNTITQARERNNVEENQ